MKASLKILTFSSKQLPQNVIIIYSVIIIICKTFDFFKINMHGLMFSYCQLSDLIYCTFLELLSMSIDVVHCQSGITQEL